MMYWSVIRSNLIWQLCNIRCQQWALSDQWIYTPLLPPHPPFSLRYPPRLGRRTNAPPPWTGVRLPSHGQPGLVCPPPVLPAADHAGLPLWSRLAQNKLTEAGLRSHNITLSISLRTTFKVKRKKKKKAPCPLVIAALYLALNSTLYTTEPALCWQGLNIVLWPEILCSQEIGFSLRQCEPDGPLATQ